MADAQSALAPGGAFVRKLQDATFVCGARYLVPEDRYGTVPWIAPSTGNLIVADCRIDNRHDLLDRLSLDRKVQMSDAWLLSRTYDRFGDDFVNYVVGDFAVAIWDAQKRRLVLARDITGQRPLNYHVASDFVAFSTMPHGLVALDPALGEPDERQIAEFLADVPRSGTRTFFKRICRVEPGHVVTIGSSGISSKAYWRGPSKVAHYSSDAEYEEALREHLAHATSVRLRAVDRQVGAQLSGGLDSGAVATTAAMLLRPSGERIMAFTASPRAGFSGALPRGRIADEMALAARVAGLHPNLDHRVVRPQGVSPLAIIRRDSGRFGEPLGLPCNQVWVAGIADAAKAANLNVMLVGDMGNHSLSNGGAAMLAQYTRQARLGSLVHESLALRRRGLRWRGIAYSAFAPWIPMPLWRVIMRLHWGRSTSTEGMAMMSSSARDFLASDAAKQSRSGRPAVDQRRARIKLMQDADPGLFRKGMLAGWGFEERDPTADQRLADFCLSLPPEQLLRGGVTRRIARRALADRLPPEVIDGPRGYQGADWYERMDPAELLHAAEEFGSQLGSDSPVNLEAIALLLEDWPSSDWETGTVISRYRYGLLRALAGAAFLAAFRGGAGLTALRASGPPARYEVN